MVKLSIEMTASMALHIASAVIHLLRSLEIGKAADRQNEATYS